LQQIEKGENMNKLIIFGLITLFVSGCASVDIQPPSKRSFEKNRNYSISFEKTWIRAVDWFADHNVVIEKIEKESGLLTAKYLIEANDGYLDCGEIKATGTLGGAVIDKYGSLNVTVREIDQGTSKINVNFFGEFKLTANDAYDGRAITSSGSCVSTGKLEKDILTYIGS
jgi:hypothetical protein